MRIGLIAYEFLPGIGGMQRVTEALATHLGTRHEVTVFGRSSSVRGEGAYRHEPILTGDLAVDAPRLSTIDVDVWLSPNAGAAPLALLTSVPVVVYANGNDFLNPWIGRSRRWFPLVSRVPGGWRILPRLRQAQWRADLRQAFTRVARIVAVSTFTAASLRRNYPHAADRCIVIPPGVDEIFFQAHAPASGNGVLRLLSVTRLSEAARRKNIDSVLRAMAALPPSVQVSYTIVGDGDDRARLERLAADLGLAGRTTFTGKLSAEALLACYAEADLFVLASHASRRDVEGFGIVYMEATAAGVPVMGSASGGATDAVQDGVNGILVPDGSPEAIKAGIERFLTMRDGFSRESVRQVAHLFRWDAIVRKLEVELISVIGRAP